MLFSDSYYLLCRKASCSVVIETDASYQGIRAALKQSDTDALLHPVAYFLRKLSATEKKMEVIYLECRAIKDEIKYWKYYLIDREFLIYSDHKPLENLRCKRVQMKDWQIWLTIFLNSILK